MRTLHGTRRELVPGSALTSWWTSWYTRGVPAEARERRIAEIRADVHDHRCAAELAGTRAPQVQIGWRTVRGIPADVSWRREERRAMRSATREARGHPLHTAWAVLTQTWFAPIAVLIGGFDVLVSVAVVLDDESSMPGQAIGPAVMTVLALGLFVGLWLRWRHERGIDVGRRDVPSGVDGLRRLLPTVVVVAGVGFLVVGIVTGTPTIVVGAVALLAIGGRTLAGQLRLPTFAGRPGLADALIVAGTLPALAFFWLIIPLLLALAVIAGVLGTNPGVRTR